MTKLNWRKYPDEKPLETEDDGILVVVNTSSGRPYVRSCGYDRCVDHFYNYENWMTESNKIAFVSDHIVYWTYTDELPLPKEYL